MVLSKSAMTVVILVLSWLAKKLQMVPSDWVSFFVLLLRRLRFFRSLFFLQIFVLKILEDPESGFTLWDSREKDCYLILWRERAGGLRNSVFLQPSNSTRRWSHLPTFCSHALRAVENKKGVVTLILANSSVEITCWIPLLICSVKVSSLSFRLGSNSGSFYSLALLTNRKGCLNWSDCLAGWSAWWDRGLSTSFSKSLLPLYSLLLMNLRGWSSEGCISSEPSLRESNS